MDIRDVRPKVFAHLRNFPRTDEGKLLGSLIRIHIDRLFLRHGVNLRVFTGWGLLSLVIFVRAGPTTGGSL